MKEWLEELNKETLYLFHHLDLYKKLIDIINNNSQLKRMDNTVLLWMERAFTRDLVIGICRICDRDKESLGLARFLEELKNKPELLTRTSFISLYDRSDLCFANMDFDNMAGKDKQSFPIDEIEADIKSITKDEPFNKLKTYRDQYLAHSDREKEKISLSYDELFNAFKIVEKVINKYNGLIRSSTFLKLEPEMQGYWQEPFTIPWIIGNKD